MTPKIKCKDPRLCLVVLSRPSQGLTLCTLLLHRDSVYSRGQSHYDNATLQVTGTTTHFFEPDSTVQYMVSSCSISLLLNFCCCLSNIVFLKFKVCCKIRAASPSKGHFQQQAQVFPCVAS